MWGYFVTQKNTVLQLYKTHAGRKQTKKNRIER